MPELSAGVLRGLFAKVVAEAENQSKQALTATALEVEREAKLNVGKGGAHKYGTPTPASPGGPPALISGTLRRSVTHTPVKPFGLGWETRVGVAQGVYPPYGKTRTQSSRYGYFLETGLRNGTTYPWLMPAFKTVLPRVVGIQVSYFRSAKWPKAR